MSIQSVRKEPICIFNTEKELNISLKEWQDRLFLSDWFIKASLVDANTLIVNGHQLAGYNECFHEMKSCYIDIVKPNDSILHGKITKFCQESTLVHELLHCKYNVAEYKGNSVEAVYYGLNEHTLIEEMARSLIMAKYDIPLKWFSNIKN